MHTEPTSLARWIVPVACLLVGLVVVVAVPTTTLVHVLGVALATAGLIGCLRRARARTRTAIG